MSTDQNAVMFYGWGVKAGWLIPLVDKCVDCGWQCDPLLTCANLSAFEMSITHIIHYKVLY